MGVVEDVRQVLQDFLSPELRAITARIDALEKVMHVRFDLVDQEFASVDMKFETVNAKFESVESRWISSGDWRRWKRNRSPEAPVEK